MRIYARLDVGVIDRRDGQEFGPVLSPMVGIGTAVCGGKVLEMRVSRIAMLCAVIISATALSMPIAGLIGVCGTASAQDEETVLRVGFMQKIDSLNPMLGLTDAAYVFYGLVYDALHSVGDDFETVANLAVDWRVVPTTDPELVASGEPEGSVWEFDLTTNAYWHDGEPLTAADVAWCINLNANYYDEMWAYQPYAFFMDYAEAVDDTTVRIHFYDRDTGTPIPAAYAQLVCIPMVPRHKLQSMSTSDIAFSWPGYFADEDVPIVGTGPFMAGPDIADEYYAGDRITLYRNPNYHWEDDKGLNVSFDKLIMYFYDDATAMNLALKNGELDIAQFPPSEYDTIKAAVEGGTLSNIVTYDGLKCTQYWTEIGINTNTAGPNQARLDPAVRQAMAMATNKEYIVDNFYYGYAEVGSTLISPVNEYWHYEPTADELYNWDLDEAAATLEAAGYRYPSSTSTVRVAEADSLAVQMGWVEPGKELVFDMLIRIEFPEEKQIAAYLKDKWAEVGMTLNYRVITEAELGKLVYAYAYDTMIWYWSADPDPNFMLFCQSKVAWNGWNDNLYSNPAYEENYTKSISEFDEAQRKVYTDNCQKINYEDAAYIILAYPYQTYAWRTDTFEGWGDWESDPGRSMDAFWTGNPLFMDLEPLVQEPSEPTDDSWIYVAVGGGARVVVVVAVVAVMMMKKKGGGKKEEKGGVLGE